MRLKIAIATGGRADWGLLCPIARRLREDAEVTILAGNMHLIPSLGMTVNEIRASGFEPVEIPSSGTPAQILAATIAGYSQEFERLRPDVVIILGDRYEMLGVASAALLAGVPIAHIAGGAVSEGAFDDSIRHSITKMATLHFPETPHYRNNILQMGENPDNVITAGAIGISAFEQNDLLDCDELQRQLGLELRSPFAVVTLHAATLETRASTARQMEMMLQALEMRNDLTLVFTHPNNDVDPEPQIALIEEFCRRNSGRAVSVASLGHKRYLSLLQYADAMIGNSSSGIVEAPSMGVPTLDIGIRQRGRDHGPSVVHCDIYPEDILKGLERVLSKEMKQTAARRENPYYRPDTLDIICRSILNYPWSPYPSKRFFSISSATSQSSGVSRSIESSRDMA